MTLARGSLAVAQRRGGLLHVAQGALGGEGYLAVQLLFVRTLGVAREGLTQQRAELGLHVERLARVVLRGHSPRRSDKRLSEPTSTGALNGKTTR